MDTLGTNQEYLESIKARLLEKGFNLSPEDVNGVVGLIKDEIGYWYVNQLIKQVEKILEINPSLTESEILQLVARNIVEYLGAEAASVRIYDPEKKGMGDGQFWGAIKVIGGRRNPMEQKIEREWTSIVCPEGKEKVSVLFEWDTVTEKGRFLKRTLKQIDCHNPQLTEFGGVDCNGVCEKVIVKRER